MCGIIDVNVLGEALGGSPTEAGPRFVAWASSGGTKLVVSRASLAEIRSGKFRLWFQQGMAANRVRQVADETVEARTKILREEGKCRSDDEHILALAQASRARLLYTNDPALQRDFGDPALISGPRGKVYSTRRGKAFGRTHRSLLSRNVCEDGC